MHATLCSRNSHKARELESLMPGWSIETLDADDYPPEGARAIAKLLGEIEGREDRRARYVSELVAIAPDGEELRGRGILEGRIAREPRGSGGFGFDPVFVPDGEESTVAELGDEWKSKHSHRARA